MSFYPPKVSERFYAAKFVGNAVAANAIGTSATFVCGAGLRFSLRIDRATKEILEARYQSNGCGYLIAAAETAAEKIVGEKLTAFHRHLDGKVLENAIKSDLGEFDESRKHCRKLVLETLQKAFADFRRTQIEEWTGEKALICTCFGVSEETVEILAANNPLLTVEEITDACRAGGGCGSCQPLIQDIIDVVRRENF